MSIAANLIKAAGVAAVVSVVSIGAASAAVADWSANVRSGPSVHNRVVNHIWPGEFVRVTGQSNGWCKVSIPGPDGWVTCTAVAGGGFDPIGHFGGGPGFAFSFGGPSIHVHPHSMWSHPWWW